MSDELELKEENNTQNLDQKINVLLKTYDQVQKLIISFNDKINEMKSDIIKEEKDKINEIIIKIELLKQELDGVDDKLVELCEIESIPDDIRNLYKKVDSLETSTSEMKKDINWIKDFIKKSVASVYTVIGFLTLISLFISLGVLPVPTVIPESIIKAIEAIGR